MTDEVKTAKAQAKANTLDAFLISLAFFATTCLAFAKKLDMLELTWLLVFMPVMGYFAVVAAGVAAVGLADLWPFLRLSWRTWRLQRLIKRVERLNIKVMADVERIERMGGNNAHS